MVHRRTFIRPTDVPVQESVSDRYFRCQGCVLFERLSSYWRRFLRLPGIRVAVRTLERSDSNHAQDMAASVAFFGFFSIFPLLVGIVAVGSLFLETPELQARLDQVILGEFPGSEKFIRDNLYTLIELRSAAGVASVAGLLWSASKMFGAVTRGLNLSFGVTREVPFYLSRIKQLAVALGVSIFVIVVLGLATLVEVVTNIDLTHFGLPSLQDSIVWTRGVSWFVVSVLFLLMYRLLPKRPPTWRRAIPGALLGALLFELGKWLFVLYLDGAGNLDAIYGSLTSASVLMLWLYLSARFFLLGAEFVVALEEQRSDS